VLLPPGSAVVRPARFALSNTERPALLHGPLDGAGDRVYRYLIDKTTIPAVTITPTRNRTKKRYFASMSVLPLELAYRLCCSAQMNRWSRSSACRSSASRLRVARVYVVVGHVAARGALLVLVHAPLIGRVNSSLGQDARASLACATFL
jgi:hypothetical protein